MNSFQEGELLACGLRAASDATSPPDICSADESSLATCLVCAGSPIVTPMDRRSCEVSHKISFEDVFTIRRVIAVGTPILFAKRPIETVTASDSTVSRPPLSEALCTPMCAPSPANFGSPAAKARKHADAQT